ncbi:SatD family protein [Dethiobacter alkaliphilus]|uniref:SatD family protein n=1 Tax=Dethiobacter alkaliphilus TaxID=427926 RepID=UPI002226C70B|nr:SatD family protein [Dethiobacter alkaliphilus]MCW3490502.1 SatD family protein [Dethiobacter alkaliphilus]
MEYITIICDIKNSCQLDNREEVQLQLICTLKEVNQRFAEQIAAPFLITLGDEWQGLLHGDGDYQEIIDFFKEKLPDICFYTGIGIGEISISNFELTVNQLDGPSFHKARKAIRLAKKLGYSLVLLK